MRPVRLLAALVCLMTIGFQTAPAPAPAATTRSVSLWFTSGEQFRTVKRSLPDTSTTIITVVKALLRGPTAAERAKNIDTQIPKGVTVRSVKVDASGKVEITLTPGFLNGIGTPGTRTADQLGVLRARLGQIIYTVTQFSDVKSASVLAGSELLVGDLNRAEYNRPATKPKPIVTAPGAPAPGIKAMQQRLADLGYLPADAVDGKAGYQTMQAVLAFQSWEGLTRDGAAGPATLAKLATASRPVPGKTGPARRIEVYRDRGVTLLIEGGKVTRAIHTSSGAGANATPAGTFTVFRKELRSWSVPFKVWLPYASYFNAGIAFHEYADVPAYPASHGCIRVPAPEAVAVYAFASNGTTVVVI